MTVLLYLLCLSVLAVPTILMLIVLVNPVAGLGEGAGIMFELDDQVATARLLEAGGFTVSRNEPGDPGDGNVWLTDATPDALRPAREFLEADARRGVLALGRGGPEWARLGAVVLDDPENFEALRDFVMPARR